MLPPGRAPVMSCRSIRLLHALTLLAAVASAQAVSAPAAPLVPLPPQPPDVPLPTGHWPTGPLPARLDVRALDHELSVVNAPRPRLGETREVVIIWRGRLVSEAYMPGYGPETPLLSWSKAKSITHALTGIAVRRGLVDIDKPMGNPRWGANDPRQAIPWRHWLNMVDGQAYREIGEHDQAENDAAKMHFGRGRLDVSAYAASLPLIHPPGSHWNYNSAAVNLIADALTHRFAPGAPPTERRARIAAVLTDELFGPLGMRSAQPEFDAAGTFIGSSLLYATARDFARFGLLYMRDGVWEKRRILPAGWVDFARSKTPAGNCDVYGALFWIAPVSGRGKPYSALAPDGPRDLFAAQGHEGQLTAMVPSKDLILVRLGRFENGSGWRALGDWVQRIVALFPDVPPALSASPAPDK
jgi:CubicO group peptidase (beta-lactamase class C family)